MKYVAFVNADGGYQGWTTKANYKRSCARGFDMIESDEGETTLEFDGPEYDPDGLSIEDADKQFAFVGKLARLYVENK